MRKLHEIFESVVKSYDNNEVINFVDVRDLGEKLPKNSDLFIKFVNGYNGREFIKYSDLRELEMLANASKQIEILPPLKTQDWWNDLYTDVGGTCFSDADSEL